MSLSSENPYATIRDLPGLPGEPRESGYVEMKGPPSVSPSRQPLHLRDRQQRQLQPQRDSGTYEQPSPLSHSESSMSPAGATGHWNMRSRKGEGEGREANSVREGKAKAFGGLGLRAGMVLGELPSSSESVLPLKVENLRWCLNSMRERD